MPHKGIGLFLVKRNPIILDCFKVISALLFPLSPLGSERIVAFRNGLLTVFCIIIKGVNVLFPKQKLHFTHSLE